MKPALSVELDMIRGTLPNPYTLREEDVGRLLTVGWGFGNVLKRDVGKRCQLVPNDAGDNLVFQMENDEQRNAKFQGANI